MLGKLVIASFPFTEKVCAEEVQVLIVNVDLAGCDLVFHNAVGVITGYGIPAGFIQYIRRPAQLKGSKAVR